MLFILKHSILVNITICKMYFQYCLIETMISAHFNYIFTPNFTSKPKNSLNWEYRDCIKRREDKIGMENEKVLSYTLCFFFNTQGHNTIPILSYHKFLKNWWCHWIIYVSECTKSYSTIIGVHKINAQSHNSPSFS